MGSDLVHLDGKLLEILEAVVMSHATGTMDDVALLGLLSSYASAGIQHLRGILNNKNRTELLEFFLS